jgi:hypothetical protein
MRVQKAHTKRNRRSLDSSYGSIWVPDRGLMQALKQWVYRSTMHGLYTQMYCSVLRILYRQKGSISVQWARVKNTKSVLLELLPLLGVVSVAHKKNEVLCSSRSIWVIWVPYFEWGRWLGAGNACSRKILSSPSGQRHDWLHWNSGDVEATSDALGALIRS